MSESARPEVAKRRPMPPFAETLAGLAPSMRISAFDATIGREALAMTMGAPAADATSRVLPTVSIDFSERTAAPALVGPDLRVIAPLGEGGMGVVSLAEQRSLDRLVAVKTTRVDATASADAALCEEAVVTGRLEHPNVVPVHAFGRTADGRPVMVMKRIEGVAWRSLLLEPEHPAWESITTGDRLVDHLQILVQVANALSFAHSRKVVHRDVKPENVMVGYFGEVLLVDFGLAVRLDRPEPEPSERCIVGTPAYMAPEMVAGLAIDERTDVYLLGATLHEILVGHAPHDGDTLTEVLAHAYASEPPEFGHETPTELADVCRHAMARYSEDRLADARAFRSAIQEYLTHRASHALVSRGEERLVEAEAAPSAAVRRIAFTEARFACRQAIEQWSGNETAKRVEREAILASVELELTERNAIGARGLMHGLDAVPVDVEARVASLEAELENERRGSERLRALERDLDPSLDATGRHNAMVALAVVATCLSFYVTQRSRTRVIDAGDVVRIACMMFAIVTVGLGVFWKRVASNAFGRKLTIAAWSSSLMMVVHRIISYVVHQEIPTILMEDSLLFTGMILTCGIVLDQRILAVVPFTLAGAIGSALDPAHAPMWFSGSTTALLVGVALFFRFMQKSEGP